MLPDQTDRFQLPVQLAGSVASGIVDKAGPGRIAALFDSSFYIETADGLVCLGNENLAASPLNLATTAPPATNWRASGMQLHQKVSISQQAISVGSRFSFPLSGMRIWSPALLAPCCKLDLEQGLECFRIACKHYEALDGLDYFPVARSRPRQSLDTGAVARRPIRALREWLATLLRNPDNKILLDLDSVMKKRFVDCFGSRSGRRPRKSAIPFLMPISKQHRWKAAIAIFTVALRQF